MPALPVRGVACDLGYTALWLALLPLYRVDGGAGLTVGLVGVLVYLWATGLYRYYRPFECVGEVRGAGLAAGSGALLAGLSALALSVSLAAWAAARHAATGEPVYSYLFTASTAAGVALEVYAFSYLPARAAARLMEGGLALALALAAAQLAVGGLVAWAVDRLVPPPWGLNPPVGLGGHAGNMAAAHALRFLVARAR